jgi:UDP-glucuronate 4-epimerase
MRVAVTGGAGFIGSHLVERLVEEGHTAVIIDSFDDFYEPSQKLVNISNVMRGRSCFLAAVDIRDIDAVRTAISGCDAVVHLAAKAGVRPSFERPRLYADTNVTGTRAVLHAASEVGVPRFVFASSSSVYGDGSEPPFSEDGGLGVPKSPYASTKVEGERLCRSFERRFDHIAVLRFFSVYGPRQRPDLALHKFAACARDDKPIPVFGSLDSFRDYTFVSDIVSGVVAALAVEDPWLVANLGSGSPVTLGRMIDEVERVMGTEVERRELPAHDGDLHGTAARIDFARDRLGYAPSKTFEQGVDEFINWFMNADEVAPAVPRWLRSRSRRSRDSGPTLERLLKAA